MTEQDMNLGSLTAQEFEQVMNEVATPDFHDLTTEDFFAALAAIDAETPRETLELTASVTNGQLTFLEPAPLHAHGNEIRLGDKRVVIKLVPEGIGQAA